VEEDKKGENLGEERIKKTLGLNANKKDAKREREEYAVNLRKAKREDLLKRRRNIGNS
jgi:hypothetical protein